MAGLERRRFLVAAAALLVAPSARSAVRRIGRLVPVSADAYRTFAEEVRAGLAELGWREGTDYVFVSRYANGNFDRLPRLAQELTGAGVDVILAGSNPGVEAAARATSTIPIVMVTTGDPIAGGLISSLAHPGGNVTGVTALGQDLGAKRLEVLRETLPGLRRVALLANPASPYTTPMLRSAEALAGASGIAIETLMAREASAIERAFAAIEARRPDALLVLPDALFVTQRKPIVALAARARVPAMYGEREFVTDGGLMFYGAGLRDMYRQAARYIDKILKGARPADLPVEEPTKLELIVNQRTAKALGLSIPQSVLLRADRVID